MACPVWDKPIFCLEEIHQMHFGQVGKEQVHCQKDDGKEDVHGCKIQHIFPFFCTGHLGKIFVGDQTGHGSDQRA